MEDILQCPRCDTAVSVARADGLRGICPRCLFESLTEPDATRTPLDLLEGQELGNYVVLGLVGSGGMGVVYRARQKGLERTVALKVLNARGPGEIDRFFVEARSAAKLQHAHIVPIHEVVNDRGYYFFTMDYIEGRTLADTIAGGDVFPRRAAEWVAQVARAVHYAHENGIIHRDLKPANILIDRNGAAKVMDFGLAKDVTGESGLTTTGTTMGTPAYMPPEQALGEAVDARSDVYALGAVLYEALAGSPPFTGRNVGEILQKVIHQEPAPPTGLPADIVTVCLKAMQKEPSQRYASAAALADDLERFVRGEPVLGRRPSLAYRARRVLTRHAVAATLLAVIAGLSIWTLTRPVPDPTVRERAAALVNEAAQEIQTAEQLRDADERVRRDEFLRGAAERLDAAEAIDPDFADIPYWRGAAHLLTYRMEDAVDAFTKAILLDPQHRPARASRAVANGRLLLQSLWGTLRDPDPYRLAMLRDDIRLLDGDRLEVAQAYLAAVEATAPVLAATWSRSPIPTEVAPIRERLRAHATAAVEARPTNADAHFLAGQADYLADIKNPDRVADALRAIERALQHAPNDMWFRTLETYYLTQVGRAADAVARGRELVRVAPELDQSHIFLAVALEGSDDLAGAEAALADAMNVTRQPAYVRLWHAMLLLRLPSKKDDPVHWMAVVGDRVTRERVLEILDAAIAGDPGHVSARVLRGAIHFTIGDEPRARADFERFAAAAPGLLPYMPTIRRYLRIEFGDFAAYRRVLRVERSAGDDREYAFRLSLATTHFTEPAQLRELLQELALAQVRLGDREALLSTLTRLAENDWHGWHRVERARGFTPDAAYRELRSRFALDRDEALARYRVPLAHGRELLDRARTLTSPDDLARRGEWLDGAADELDRAVEFAPDLPDAWIELGRAEAMRGRTGAAVEAYSVAIEIEPDHVEALHGRLLACWETLFAAELASSPIRGGRLVETMRADARRLERIEAGSVWVPVVQALVTLHDLAEAHERMQADAVEEHRRRLTDLADRAVRLDDTNAYAQTIAAVSARLNGSTDELEYLKRAVDLAPNDPLVRIQSAGAYLTHGEFARAAEEIQRLESLAPRSPAVFLGRAMALKKQGLNDAAMDVLDLALEVVEDPVQIRIARAGLIVTWDAEGSQDVPPERVARALSELDAAVALDPDDPVPLFLRGMTRIQFDADPERGRADLEAVIERFPDSPWADQARRLLDSEF